MSILARSPYIVSINQPSQTNTKLELFIYNGSTVPTSPTYTFSKVIPSVTNTETVYNISDFLREKINNVTPSALYNLIGARTPSEYCNVLIKRYANNSFLNSFTYKAFDGYGYFSDGANPGSLSVHRMQGTYRYWYDVSNTPLTDQTVRAGNLSIETGVSWSIRYTNLSSGAITTQSLTNSTVVSAPCVWGSNYADGNKVEVLDTDGTIVATFRFIPITECRYTPIRIDFVNRYGAFQREWFFKASNSTIETQTTDFKMMSPSYNYLQTFGQSQEFNVTGRESIKVNTGFVDEFYGNVIQEILLSERVLIDGVTVKHKTKNIEKFKDVNTKMINYTMEFEFANDLINNIQ